MKRTAILGILALLTGLPAFGQGIESVPPQKAFELVKQPATYLVDVRSVAEYVLVGHPETAHNVPFMFWNEDEARFVANERFIEDLKARFKPGDTLVFICRGGGRSLKAAAAAREAGFEKVVNVGEGFEGAADEKGYRTKGGWKNSLPYTYNRSRPHLSEELSGQPRDHDDRARTPALIQAGDRFSSPFGCRIPSRAGGPGVFRRFQRSPIAQPAVPPAGFRHERDRHDSRDVSVSSRGAVPLGRSGGAAARRI